MKLSHENPGAWRSAFSSSRACEVRQPLRGDVGEGDVLLEVDEVVDTGAALHVVEGAVARLVPARSLQFDGDAGQLLELSRQRLGGVGRRRRRLADPGDRRAGVGLGGGGPPLGVDRKRPGLSGRRPGGLRRGGLVPAGSVPAGVLSAGAVVSVLAATVDAKPTIVVAAIANVADFRPLMDSPPSARQSLPHGRGRTMMQAPTGSVKGRSEGDRMSAHPETMNPCRVPRLTRRLPRDGDGRRAARFVWGDHWLTVE